MKNSKHKFAVLLFLMFFTLTSANRNDEKVSIIKKPELRIKQQPRKYFIIPIKENNGFVKEIGKQADCYNKIDSIIESLPKELQPKN